MSRSDSVASPPDSPELAAGVQPGVHNVEGVLPLATQAHQLGSVGVHSDPLHLAIINIIIISPGDKNVLSSPQTA